MNKLISYIPKFIKYCQIEKGLSENTLRSYKMCLVAFMGFLTENNIQDIKPEDLTKDHIWQYRLWLDKPLPNGNKRKAITQSLYLISLRQLVSYLSEQDVECLSPDKIKLPKIEHKLIRTLQITDIQILLSKIDRLTHRGLRDRAILETLFSTGLRLAELVALDRLKFEQAEEKQMELSIIGKGGKVRTVYFSDRCMKYIKMYLANRKDSEPALFYALYRGTANRINPRTVQKILKIHLKEAGLPEDITIHTLRHSYATDLLASGVDIRFVQEMLGHSDPKTTARYTHVTNKQLRDIHKNFHSGNKLED